MSFNRKKKKPDAKSLFPGKKDSGKKDPGKSTAKTPTPGALTQKASGPKGPTLRQETPQEETANPGKEGPRRLPFLFDEERNLVRLRRQRLDDLMGDDFMSKWKNSDAYIGSNMLDGINRWQDITASDIARAHGRDKVLVSDIRAAEEKRSSLRSLDYRVRRQAERDRADAFYELWKENNRNARAANVVASTESAAKQVVASAQQRREQAGAAALNKPVTSVDEPHGRLEQTDYKGGRSAQKQDRAQGSSTSFNFDAGVKPPVKTARAAAQSNKYLDSNGQVTKERQAEIDKEMSKGGTKIFINGHKLTRREAGRLDGKPIYVSGVDPSKAKTASEWQQRWKDLKQKAEDANGELQGSLSSDVYVTDKYTGERLTPTEVNRAAQWGAMARESRQATQQIQGLERRMLAPANKVPVQPMTLPGRRGKQSGSLQPVNFGRQRSTPRVSPNAIPMPDVGQLGSAFRLGGDAAKKAWDAIESYAKQNPVPRVSPNAIPMPDVGQLGSAFHLGGDAAKKGFSVDGGLGAKWKRFYQRRIDAMEGFGDRVGRAIGETLQMQADKMRQRGFRELEASGKRKKRDYQRQQFMRIAR